MARPRRKYDAEFQAGAVRIVRETGKPIARVARDLDVCAKALGRWVAKDKAANPNLDLSEDERAELIRLRKENAQIRMERDVFKRSVALWVKEAMGR